MIVVRVELWSAVNGRRTELARMRIANDGETTVANPKLGTYVGETLRGRSSATLDRGIVQRRGKVRDWPREALHVWNLVARMLGAMGYDKGPPAIPAEVDDPIAHTISEEVLELLDGKLGEEFTVDELATVTSAALSAVTQLVWRYRPAGMPREALVQMIAGVAGTYVDQLADQDDGLAVQ